VTRPGWLPPVEPDEFSEAVVGREVAVESYPLWAQHRRVPPPPPAQVVRLVPVARTTRVPLEGPRVTAVARIARECGEVGITCLELEEETGWRHSVASAALSTAKKRGLVAVDGQTRDGFGVHVAVSRGDQD
jgi:hypothetical protein